MPDKPVAILLTRNLPPLQGGMERLGEQIAIALLRRYKLLVIGPKGCFPYLPKSVRVFEVPLRPLPLFLLCSCVLGAYLSRKHHATLAVGGSGLMAIALLMIWRRSKTVVFIHGLDLVTSNFFYRLFWIPALRRMHLAIANSRSTADIARRLAVARRNIRIVNPGTKLPDLSEDAGERFRRKFDLTSSRLLLFVGRNTRRKGLSEFIANALPRIVKDFPTTILAIVGDDAPDSLNTKTKNDYDSILAIARSVGMESHIKIIGRCDDEELHDAYAGADIHVFPVRHTPGDVEGFGMVAIEAAAHGTPTVAFAVGGVPDAVEHGVSGYLLPPEDYTKFSEAVCGLLASGQLSDMNCTARKFAENFQWEKYHSRVLTAIHDRESRKSTSTTRDAHAVLDLLSRTWKAKKIEQIVGFDKPKPELRILEIGTGSGGIASYFATHPAMRCSVESVDTTDTRLIKDGYRFTLVHNTTLPFDSNEFDLVISNHVLEHVGEFPDQFHHLQEIFRVLCREGTAYLAIPNRWQVTEPHYRLAFLSWLPAQWRTPYLRFRNRGQVYDCKPLSVGQLELMLLNVGFEYEHHHRTALLATYAIEQPHSFICNHIWKRVPRFAFEWTRRMMPTLVYTLRKPEEPRHLADSDFDQTPREASPPKRLL